MMQRIVLVLAAAGIAAAALWHPAPRLAFVQQAAPVSAASPRLPHARRSRRGPPAGSEATVYVAGAVAKPGLYRVAAGARADAIAAAGGLARSADPAAVNLAAFVRDGDEVLVPPSGGAAPRARRVRRSRRAAAAPPVALDVNAAGTAELAAVPGIGRSIAARIVAMREADGTFSSLDELLDVAGMTQARLERARPYLDVSP
jgi:competence protein ComEA